MRALLTGSAPLMSHSSPAPIAALSAAVSGSSELKTTITGVPLASGNDACCSASARLLSTVAARDLEASLLVTLESLGPMERRPATTIQAAITIQGCLPRTDQVMMRRMCRLLSAWNGPSVATSYWSGEPPAGSRRAGNRVP